MGPSVEDTVGADTPRSDAESAGGHIIRVPGLEGEEDMNALRNRSKACDVLGILAFDSAFFGSHPVVIEHGTAPPTRAAQTAERTMETVTSHSGLMSPEALPRFPHRRAGYRSLPALQPLLVLLPRRQPLARIRQFGSMSRIRALRSPNTGLLGSIVEGWPSDSTYGCDGQLGFSKSAVFRCFFLTVRL
ncbi:hypothetical protein BJ742DRAFT_21751 [Cladochytrium replicatum]|nr:hypothetical protein BJ742DRAFT_21751 [Cladochytrium replicatum]